MWHDGLTEKQRRFVEAYSANGGNATRAAEAAGYKNPHPQGAQTLRNVTVRAALERLRSEATQSAIATREQRQAFWTRVMMGHERDAEGNPPRMADRLKAAELLGKSQADFVERRELSGEVDFRAKVVKVPAKKVAQIEKMARPNGG